MNPTICDAIRTETALELRYHDYSRTVEPHAYGRDKVGEEILRCYQVAGGSQSRVHAGWKLLKVAEVYAVQKTNQKFKCRPEYRRNDSAMGYIFVQI